MLSTTDGGGNATATITPINDAGAPVVKANPPATPAARELAVDVLV